MVRKTVGAGNGPTDKWFIGAIAEAVARGLVSVNITQCSNGSVHPMRYLTGYELARAGEEVTMRKATVNIYELELREYDLPRIRIRVRCSKGTYIRSLAHEIGQALESGAHLTSLRRTRSGGFTLGGLSIALHLEPGDTGAGCGVNN